MFAVASNFSAATGTQFLSAISNRFSNLHWLSIGIPVVLKIGDVICDTYQESPGSVPWRICAALKYALVSRSHRNFTKPCSTPHKAIAYWSVVATIVYLLSRQSSNDDLLLMHSDLTSRCFNFQIMVPAGECRPHSGSGSIDRNLRENVAAATG